MCAKDGRDFSGKVVLIDRGTCTFEEKVSIAKEQGAIGVVMAITTTIDIGFHGACSVANTIPAVFVNGPDKLTLRKP